MKAHMFRRFIASLLCAVTMLYFVAPVLEVQAAGSEYTKSEKAVISQVDAVTWLTSEMNRLSWRCQSAVDADNVYDALVSYAAYLMYCEWIFANVYSTTDAATVSGGTMYTVIDPVFSGNEEEEVKALLDVAKRLKNLLSEKSSTLFPEVPADYLAFLNKEVPGSEALEGDTADAKLKYAEARQAIVSSYIVKGLEALIPSEVYFSYNASENTVSGDLASFVDSQRESIAPYLNVLNKIIETSDTLSGRGLSECELLVQGTNTKLYGYTQEISPIFNIMPPRIQTLYSYVFSTSEVIVNRDVISSSGINWGDTLNIFGRACIEKDEQGVEKVVPSTSDGKVELTAYGYAALAAGVVYEPFLSTAGCESYVQLLTALLEEGETDETTREKILKAVQSAVSVRKPLLVYNFGGGMKMSELETVDFGEYETALLSHILFDQMPENTMNVFVAPMGSMRPSQVDSSTFEYVTSEGVLVVPAGGATPATAQQVTRPVAAFTKNNNNAWSLNWGKLAHYGTLTAFIVNNAAVEYKELDAVKRPYEQPLFLDGLGNIVLQDGTIVLPAIANPMLYSAPEDLDTWSATVELTGKAKGKYMEPVTDGNYYYYPYTAAFCNTYPDVSIASNGYVTLNNPHDVGKMVLGMYIGDEAGKWLLELLTRPGYKIGMAVSKYLFNEDQTFSSTMASHQIVSVDKNKHIVFGKASDAMLPIDPYSFDVGNGQIPTGIFKVYEAERNQKLQFGWTAPEWLSLSAMVWDFSTPKESHGYDYFPVQYEPDLVSSYLSISLPLARSALRYISTMSSATGERVSNGAIDTSRFVLEFMGQGMLGNAYSATIIKNLEIDYGKIVEDQYGRFTALLVQFTQATLETFGHTDGVLAIKNCYENKFFNALVAFIQQYYIVILIVILIMVAVKFLNGHYGLAYVVFIGFLAFAAFEVYAVWMPTAVPSAYNFISSDIAEDSTWDTVTMIADSYAETYADSNRKDAISGEERPYTATLTLYRLTQAEMEHAAAQLGVSIDSVRAGEKVYLDRTAGIFLQGDAIKVSIDSLLANNTMRGLYMSQWQELGEGKEIQPIDESLNSNPYIIKLTSPYVSLEAYYMPFDHIERAFLVNLNNFTNIFMIERDNKAYGKGLYKDTFVFYSFTNSGIFLAPGNREVLAENIEDGVIDGSRIATMEDFFQVVETHFNPQNDWLNLDSIFYYPGDAMKNSLWGLTMQERGYYGDDWSISKEQREKIDTLIAYINDQTKLWVIDHYRQLQLVSDENAIKMISLYATTCFTHKVSNPQTWLYPNYINAHEMELTDIFLGTFASVDSRNAQGDNDVVELVATYMGAPGVIMLFLIIVFSALFVFVLNYLVPCLYAMFGGVLVFKLMNEQTSIGVVSGYIKVTLTTVILYLLYSFGLRAVSLGGYMWYGYLITLIITLLCVYFLFFVIMSVLTNPLELGNENLGKNLFRAVDNLTGKALGKLVTKTLQAGKNATAAAGGLLAAGAAAAYAKAASVDAIPGLRNGVGRKAQRPTRSEHYGRWSDFDDDTLSARSRVINRFGNISDHMEEIGTTKTGFRQTKALTEVRAAVAPLAAGVKEVKQVARLAAGAVGEGAAAVAGPAGVALNIAGTAAKATAKAAAKATAKAAGKAAKTVVVAMPGFVNSFK